MRRCEDSDSPESGWEPCTGQKIPASALQAADGQLRRRIGVGIASLSGCLVDGVLPAVGLELLVDELRPTVTVQPEVERVRETGMIVVDLGQ